MWTKKLVIKKRGEMQKTNFIILINILIIFIIIGLNGNVNGYEVITQTCEPDQYSQGYCLMEFNNSNFDNNSNSVLQLLHTTCNNNEVLVNTEYVSLDSDVEIANNHTAFKVRAETTEICESTFGVVLLVESNNENYDVITNCTCLSVPPYCVRTCEVANGVGTQVCVSTLRASFWTACNATGCLSGYQLTTINNFTSVRFLINFLFLFSQLLRKLFIISI